MSDVKIYKSDFLAYSRKALEESGVDDDLKEALVESISANFHEHVGYNFQQDVIVLDKDFANWVILSQFLEAIAEMQRREVEVMVH